MSAPDKRPTWAVKEIAKIPITGDVIPPQWFQHVRTDKGRLDAIGVLLLGRIFYWYRPKAVEEEATGKVLRYERKFAGEKLQVNRKEWAAHLGISTDQFD